MYVTGRYESSVDDFENAGLPKRRHRQGVVAGKLKSPSTNERPEAPQPESIRA